MENDWPSPDLARKCLNGNEHRWEYNKEPFTHNWWCCRVCKRAIETNTLREWIME